MRSRKNKVLYELVAREIDASFVEAQRRLSLRQSFWDTARPGVAQGEGREGGADCAGDDTEPPKLDRLLSRIPSISRTAELQRAFSQSLTSSTSTRCHAADSRAERYPSHVRQSQERRLSSRSATSQSGLRALPSKTGATRRCDSCRLLHGAGHRNGNARRGPHSCPAPARW